MISRPPVMPPTIDPASLVRKATTNQIQNAFQNQRTPARQPGYLGPPIAQPPSATPLPPQHIDPIKTAQSDPFTAGPSFGPMPPTHQPPRTGVTPFPYEAFQNALRASGRLPDAGGTPNTPPIWGTPGAMTGGGTPTQAGSQGSSLPDPLPPDGTGGNDYGPPAVNPTPTPGPGPGETTPLTPVPFPTEPGTLGPGDINPGSLPPQTPNPLDTQPPFFEGGYNSIPNPNGEGYVPNLGGAQSNFTGTPSMYPTTWNHDSGQWAPVAQANDGGSPDDSSGEAPGGSGRGGEGGPGGGGRVWDAGLMKWVLPYGIGHVAHALGEMYRNYRANNTAGPGGRGGGGTGGGLFSSGVGETPDERAHGDRNFTMAGGNSYYDAPSSGSHFNYGTGRYELNRNPGAGFSSSDNQGAAQQSHSPRAFGMHAPGDGGHSMSHTLTPVELAARVRRSNADPQRAQLAAYAALMNSQQNRGNYRAIQQQLGIGG